MPGRRTLSIFEFLFSILLSFVVGGCAAPGDPVPPRPTIPVAITDLAAHQEGPAVVLRFTLPQQSTEGEELENPPDIEIFRSEAVRAGGAAPSDLIFTVPSAVVDTYRTGTQIRFEDPLPLKNLTSVQGKTLGYMVRTRVSAKRASEDSNVASVGVFPPPQQVESLTARPSQTAVELDWNISPSAGGAAATITGFRVYRAELLSGSTGPSGPLELLGVAAAAPYRDANFEFGHTYRYTVRSVAQYGASSVESKDSLPAMITPRDAFPPAIPSGLAASLLPAVEACEGVAAAPAQVELSWDISLESDLAGYNIYRSSEAETRGERLNGDALLTPAFRDTKLVSGHTYYYRVTSFDRNGNESPASPAVMVEVPRADSSPGAVSDMVTLRANGNRAITRPSSPLTAE